MIGDTRPSAAGRLLVAKDGAGLLNTKIKTVATIIIALASLAASSTAHAADRIPSELLGCSKYVEASSGVRNPDSIYRRIDSKDCKGEMLISSDGWVGDYDAGKIDCPLRSVIFSDTKRGRYKFGFACREGEDIYSTMRLKGNVLTITEGVVP